VNDAELPHEVNTPGSLVGKLFTMSLVGLDWDDFMLGQSAREWAISSGACLPPFSPHAHSLRGTTAVLEQCVARLAAVLHALVQRVLLLFYRLPLRPHVRLARAQLVLSRSYTTGVGSVVVCTGFVRHCLLEPVLAASQKASHE
jgi:hypothetical protein